MNLACLKPFKTIEVHTNGDISLCCFSWLPYFCGNVLEAEVDQILKNIQRVEILSNMRQGNFSHCNDRCPHIAMFKHGQTPSRFVKLENLDSELSSQHWDIHLTYDQSCNLACPSCRSELILFKNGSNDLIQKIHKKTTAIVDYLLSKNETVTVHVTGSGDPFASPVFWEYLKTASENIKDNLYFEIITNGTLMTPVRLQKVSSLLPKIKIINVSIDASNSNTYSKVRKNGNFDKLVENLNYLDSLGVSWMSNFTVQNENIEDLVDFVNWQLNYKNLKSVSLNGISKWGHMTDDQYNKMAVWKHDHINNFRLKEILSDSIFYNKKVKMGNLSGLLK